MRSLLGLSFLLLAVGCSNACPPPVLCTQPHPDNCPCNVDDAGSTPRPDAYREPVDAFVADDADLDAALPDTGTADDAGDDTGVDAP